VKEATWERRCKGRVWARVPGDWVVAGGAVGTVGCGDGVVLSPLLWLGCR